MSKEPHWIIEGGPPTLKVRIPSRSAKYVQYKEKEESGDLKKLLPHAHRPKAEQLLTMKDYDQMLVVGPGVDPELSTINSRGDVETSNAVIAWETWQTLLAAKFVPGLHPNSDSIELAEQLAKESYAADEVAKHEKVENKRKKLLAESSK